MNDQEFRECWDFVLGSKQLCTGCGGLGVVPVRMGEYVWDALICWECGGHKYV